MKSFQKLLIASLVLATPLVLFASHSNGHGHHANVHHNSNCNVDDAYKTVHHDNHTIEHKTSKMHVENDSVHEEPKSHIVKQK